jgi:hypothetical protein
MTITRLFSLFLAGAASWAAIIWLTVSWARLLF